MSRNAQSTVTAPLKVLGIPENFCYESMPQFIQALTQFLVAVIPTSITNVVVGNIQPNDTQRFTLWVALDNAGKFVGLKVYSEGEWVLLFPPQEKTWDVEFTTSAPDDMTFTNTEVLEARYFEMGDFVWVTGRFRGTTGGTARNGIWVSLPVEAFTANSSLNGTTLDPTANAQSAPGVVQVVTTGLPEQIKNFVEIRKYDNSDWGLGDDREVSFNGFYKKAL